MLAKYLLACVCNKQVFLLESICELELSCGMVPSTISAKQNYSDEITNQDIAAFFTFIMYTTLNDFFDAKTLMFHFAIHNTGSTFLRQFKSQSKDERSKGNKIKGARRGSNNKSKGTQASKSVGSHTSKQIR